MLSIKDDFFAIYSKSFRAIYYSDIDDFIKCYFPIMIIWLSSKLVDVPSATKIFSILSLSSFPVFVTDIHTVPTAATQNMVKYTHIEIITVSMYSALPKLLQFV